MKTAVVQLGLADQWIWMDQTDCISDVLGQHDALVHPSYIEGLPNVVCEAMAAGRPVLASNVLEHPRLVQDRSTGLLFDPFDPSKIADAIAQLSRLTPAERERMGHRGRLRAEKTLSMSAFVTAYEALFQRLLDQPLKGRRISVAVNTEVPSTVDGSPMSGG
jgi:glycosyltransferase involved in cell wall biosynthesis